MTAGKHVFQVYWPDEGNRGTCSCVGVGSADVLLKQPGRVSLVGDHSLSWGLDLTKRRSIHFKKMEQRLHARVPEIFYMYVDLDGGNIGFGDDVVLHQKSAEFYGQILTNIPKNSSRPLYVMVSSCNPGEQIHVYYRGTAVPSGGFDLCYPIQPMEFQQFQHKQQQQQQIPYIGFNPAPMAPVASMAPMATMAPLTPPPPYEESIVPGPPIYFDPVIAKEEKIPRKKF
ncbi:uncharacterized protein LOC131928737 [Physella acuta]|uniref:uncharacterized protein LOC131928737 n=1 Tax=Physella acuta TaxID=109671 RepID=UPI0027DC79A5|nr:uncharacterized protein LOC131928737 [Physella acuta]XP_059140834.1 uncharacterized protein LOC131928737 [Physella acuta]